jgi:hypothetical protein
MRHGRPAAGGTGNEGGTGNQGGAGPAEAWPIALRYAQVQAGYRKAAAARVHGRGVRPAVPGGRAFQLAPGLPGTAG